MLTAINYKKARIHDAYNELTLNCRSGYAVIFRVYDEAAAYRFSTMKKGEIVVKNEEASFIFTNDDSAFVPFMEDYRSNKIFNSSFESHYRETTISRCSPDSLAFLPVLLDAAGNTKIVILEADLEDYPGMFLKVNDARNGFTSVFAPYPLEAERSGYSGMNLIPTKRAEYFLGVSSSSAGTTRTC
jgi:alpha-glucosidase